MRIVTRPDFDGVVCAALLYEVEEITAPIEWIEPNEVQKGTADIRSGDILANLPFDPRCTLWFDHHYTNRVAQPFEGAFAIAPSAAGVVYRHYQGRFRRSYDRLVTATDRIDSAELSLDEVRHPEKFPFVLLSMTVAGNDSTDRSYWDRLVQLLRREEVETVLRDDEVRRRCDAVVDLNRRYRKLLQAHTRVRGQVAVTDFRALDSVPEGNRFLVYSLFPETVVQVRIRYGDPQRRQVAVSVGHSIFNRNCRVNVGLMLADFEGGGHRGAGACRFDVSKAEEYIPRILAILQQNESNEPVDAGKPTAADIE
jgi:oligoribonuclease NrnB/cAMP/cGMP phosphodiesterase (DHH superfamily)